MRWICGLRMKGHTKNHKGFQTHKFSINRWGVQWHVAWNSSKESGFPWSPPEHFIGLFTTRMPTEVFGGTLGATWLALIITPKSMCVLFSLLFTNASLLNVSKTCWQDFTSNTLVNARMHAYAHITPSFILLFYMICVLPFFFLGTIYKEREGERIILPCKIVKSCIILLFVMHNFVIQKCTNHVHLMQVSCALFFF